MQKIHIKKLEQKDFPQGKKVHYTYTSDKYYEVTISEGTGWSISLKEKEFEKPFVKSIYVEVFEPDKLKLECYTAEVNGNEAGITSFNFWEWNNTVRIWDLYVTDNMQNKGIGRMLLDVVKQRARELKARAVVVETQTSNYNAIQFYKKMGFRLTGFDSISYSNEDIKNKEVRIELGLIMN
jgi:ribosomal protein S18 acetylase RimI-like enzyme